MVTVVYMLVAAASIITIVASATCSALFMHLLLAHDLSIISGITCFSSIKTVCGTSSAQMLITLVTSSLGSFKALLLVTLVHASASASVWLLLILKTMILVLSLKMSACLALLLI